MGYYDCGHLDNGIPDGNKYQRIRGYCIACLYSKLEQFIGEYFKDMGGDDVKALNITGLNKQLDFMAEREVVFPHGPVMKRDWKEVNEVYNDYWVRGRKGAMDENSFIGCKKVRFPPLNEYSRGHDKKGNAIVLVPEKHRQLYKAMKVYIPRSRGTLTNPVVASWAEQMEAIDQVSKERYFYSWLHLK